MTIGCPCHGCGVMCMFQDTGEVFHPLPLCIEFIKDEPPSEFVRKCREALPVWTGPGAGRYN